MKTEIKCSLSGTKLVRTHSTFSDDGKLQSENTSIQGEKDDVLENLNASVAEAKRDRDGMLNPLSAKPAPADGNPGVEISFWTAGNVLYRTETRRDTAGKFQSQRTEQLGTRAQRLENAEERLAELTREQDAAAAAK